MRLKEQGAALVTVLVLTTILAITSSVFMSSLHTLRRAERQNWRSAWCESTARAGIERAIWELERDQAFHHASDSIGEATYFVSVEHIPNQDDKRQITSVAEFSIAGSVKMTHSLHARVHIRPRVEIIEWLDE
ncbi:MAG: hypothetical protein QF886_09830 [Planctomycetota bacterium]|jgi:hypothetical protein|nr:hypothetical protein [Planctomycetota bacterium]